MGALVGLGVGVGLLLVWSAFALPRTPRTSARTTSSLGRLLGRAGLGDVTTASVVSLCAVLFAVAFALVQAVSRTMPVAFVFAAMAAYVPIAVLRQRAARRLREFAEVWPEAVDNLASAVRAGLSLPDAVAHRVGEPVLEPVEALTEPTRHLVVERELGEVVAQRLGAPPAERRDRVG